MPSRASWPAVVVVLTAALELALIVRARRRVIDEGSWRRAAAAAATTIARMSQQPKGGTRVEPSWARPLYFGALKGEVASSELWQAAYGWSPEALLVRTRDHTLPPGYVTLRRNVGAGVALARLDLAHSPPPPAADLLDLLPEATVSQGGRSCPWTLHRMRQTGGLGRGALVPTRRFACDRRIPWLYVGPTVLEDLDLNLRHCIWHHPTDGDPMVVRFPRVPSSGTLVIEAGLDYHRERDRFGSPVTLAVATNGKALGKLVHRDGDGWTRAQFPLLPERSRLQEANAASKPRSPQPGPLKPGLSRNPSAAEQQLPSHRGPTAMQTVSLSITVTSRRPLGRHFCWRGVVLHHRTHVETPGSGDKPQ